MVKAGALVALVAAAGFVGAQVALAAPARPLIVLFTPNITSDTSDERAREKLEVLRAQNAALAIREQMTDSGFVDVVIYAPDNALFVRAMLESKIKPSDPTLPSAEERYAIAKAAGASYAGYITTYEPVQTGSGSVDVELATEQIDGRKTWKSRHSMSVTGGIASRQSGVNLGNAVVGIASTLTREFLNGPLHELSQNTAPSLPPPQPIPVVKSTTRSSDETSGTAAVTGAPSMAVPVPLKAETPRVAPVASNEALASSGANTDGVAEAEKRQGDELLRAGDVSTAILSFRKAVSLAPRNALYRSALAQAYLQAGRKNDALSEAKRALNVIPTEDQKSRLEASRFLAEILTQNGDIVAARTTYEEIIHQQPSVVWARVELADVLAGQGQIEEAEALYKAALKLASTDKEAHLGYAKLLAAKGSYDAALTELTAASSSDDKEGRYNTAVVLFDEGVDQIIDRVEQNRSAWESKKISQEIFYKATSAQSAKVSGLVALLKAVPPPASGGEDLKQKHNKRIFAASLLLQGVASLLSQVETGDADAGNQATVFLSEFKRTMRDLEAPAKTAAP